MNFRDCFQYEDLGGIGDVVYHSDLLDSLLELYFTICPMTSEEVDEEILNWCNHHAHPYNTTQLYNYLVPWNNAHVR